MRRRAFFAICSCGLLNCSTAWSIEPQLPTNDAQLAFEAQRTRARELIQQRAAQEARDRQARMDARKRAGISLLRPASTSAQRSPGVTVVSGRMPR